jgi:hypothetical protein
MQISRRRFLVSSGAAATAVAVTAFPAVDAAGAIAADPASAPVTTRSAQNAKAPASSTPASTPTGDGQARPAPLDELFPTQSTALVRELVAVAHFDLARVRELVTRQPSLARASWDWGFGDWESALGAASHMGNRPIAELLLAHGARPDLFSAAMLGQLDVVEAMVAARPGVQATKGPHSLTLLAHARAGGEIALPVVRYLERLGGADPALPIQPLSPSELTALCGRYCFGAAPQDVLTVETYKDGISVRRATAIGRPLAHLGERVFSPAGADAVRLRFSAEAAATTLSIFDPDLVVTAKRC